MIVEALRALSIQFQPQYPCEGTRYRYDFFFKYRGYGYILEADGGQHFGYGTLMRPTLMDLDDSQERDREKMNLALQLGFRFLRIDYNFAKYTGSQMAEYLRHALDYLTDTQLPYAVSNPELYSWLLKGTNPVPLPKVPRKTLKFVISPTRAA